MRVPTRCAALVAAAVLCVNCTSGPTYSPPPERRAGEGCAIGEIWVCQDRYPSRLERERENPQVCYCDSLQRIR